VALITKVYAVLAPLTVLVDVTVEAHANPPSIRTSAMQTIQRF